MPRFKDEWVVNKALFEYTTGGSCACCSFPFFDPNGLKGLVSSVSDLETDAAEQEYQLAQRSPWPDEMRGKADWLNDSYDWVLVIFGIYGSFLSKLFISSSFILGYF